MVDWVLDELIIFPFSTYLELSSKFKPAMIVAPSQGNESEFEDTEDDMLLVVEVRSIAVDFIGRLVANSIKILALLMKNAISFY